MKKTVTNLLFLFVAIMLAFSNAYAWNGTGGAACPGGACGGGDSSAAASSAASSATVGDVYGGQGGRGGAGGHASASVEQTIAPTQTTTITNERFYGDIPRTEIMPVMPPPMESPGNASSFDNRDLFYNQCVFSTEEMQGVSVDENDKMSFEFINKYPATSQVLALPYHPGRSVPRKIVGWGLVRADDVGRIEPALALTAMDAGRRNGADAMVNLSNGKYVPVLNMTTKGIGGTWGGIGGAGEIITGGSFALGYSKGIVMREGLAYAKVVFLKFSQNHIGFLLNQCEVVWDIYEKQTAARYAEANRPIEVTVNVPPIQVQPPPVAVVQKAPVAKKRAPAKKKVAAPKAVAQQEKSKSADLQWCEDEWSKTQQELDQCLSKKAQREEVKK